MQQSTLHNRAMRSPLFLPKHCLLVWFCPESRKHKQCCTYQQQQRRWKWYCRQSNRVYVGLSASVCVQLRLVSKRVGGGGFPVWISLFKFDFVINGEPCVGRIFPCKGIRQLCVVFIVNVLESACCRYCQKV